ncbi:hypothetical protein B0O80DRAFT_499779 [Mortierella sp. GBAus27b]|nr:hypothetical protein BGX31_002439 [Mortierella sp. GBA43]KAI8351861.1 hypothetical protein B0O80DRAFT_499779 [Mortierella sp. GBAus27b]
MDKTNPMDIPEVVALVGLCSMEWYSIGYDRYGFNPRTILSCIQVSRLFRDTLIPVFWHTFDEQAMLDIPIYLIEKYMPYIRIYLNYGFRLDYPTSNRMLSTRLSWISVTPFYNEFAPLENCDIEFISNNSNLKCLEHVNYDAHCGNMIRNLKQLEYLYIFSLDDQEQGFQQALQPISETLKVLYIEGDVLHLKGMVLPNLECFYSYSLESEIGIDFLNRCPKLERVLSPDVDPGLLTELKNGANPAIKKLCLYEHLPNNHGLVEMLENRTGFQELNLNIDQGSSYRLSRAINHQASTLTQLNLHMKELCLRTVFNIVASCGLLEEVALRVIRREHMDRVLWHTHWKSPETLKSLQLSSYRPDDKSAGERYAQEKTMNDRLVRPTVFRGWTLPTREPISPDDQQFFSTLFLAAQGFDRLEDITIDYVTYTKDFY